MDNRLSFLLLQAEPGRLAAGVEEFSAANLSNSWTTSIWNRPTRRKSNIGFDFDLSEISRMVWFHSFMVKGQLSISGENKLETTAQTHSQRSHPHLE